MQQPSIFERIQTLLDSSEVVYDILHHAPVYTSEEADKTRFVSSPPSLALHRLGPNNQQWTIFFSKPPFSFLN